MMGTIESCVRRSGQWLRQLQQSTRAASAVHGTGYVLAGLLLSAAALGGGLQPFCLGLLLAMPVGWPVVLTALGSAAGYLLFWGGAGRQGMVWAAAGLVVSGCLGGRKIIRRQKFLMSAIASLLVSATGLAGQIFLQDQTGIALYLLRVALAWGSTRLFSQVYERRDTWVDWAAEAVAVLALAQITLTPWLGLGYAAAAALTAGGSFPAALLAGLALDLAWITRTPMTAVLCLGCALRLFRVKNRYLPALYPVVAYGLVAALCGVSDLHPLPGLLLGGGLGLLIPRRQQDPHRRGSVGIAQVRLELVAEVLSRVRQILMTVQQGPVDEEAIVVQAVERACSSCPCRKGCRDREPMQAIPAQLLHRAQLQSYHVPIPCRKVGRVTAELQRGQDQLRSILAQREAEQECREAVMQQYGFLSGYLRDLSDVLPESAGEKQRFQPEVAVCSAGREQSNGDRCLWFAGTGCKYYILLCDGMGTGLGAAQESKAAGEMLKNLLSAGFPASYALRSLNSLCALRCCAGAVTADLAELQLDTGRAILYKWGAMPSYLLSRSGTEKIGTAGAPPGLSVTEGREAADRLSLRRGETLVMLSDGVDGEIVMGRAGEFLRQPPGEIAAALIEAADSPEPDDATAVVIRLAPLLPGQQ